MDAAGGPAGAPVRPTGAERAVRGRRRSTRRRHRPRVRTAHQRDLDLAPLIATMLRATNPTVPDGLQRPPPLPTS